MSQYLKDPAIRALSLLGGPAVFKVEPNSPREWVSVIRQGFPARTTDFLGSNIQVTTAELAQLMGVSARTLAQRRRQGTLTQQESERLFRAARVLTRAEEVFGDLGKAFHWLKSPIIALRGETPLSLLDTKDGVEIVMDTLGRIEHGIFA